MADIEEERYQNFKPLFFPDLEGKESNSGHKMEDHKFGKNKITSKNFEVKLEENKTKEVVDLKSEIRKQGNVKITGFSTNQMKKRLAKINRDGVIPPPPRTLRPPFVVNKVSSLVRSPDNKSSSMYSLFCMPRPLGM